MNLRFTIDHELFHLKKSKRIVDKNGEMNEVI